MKNVLKTVNKEMIHFFILASVLFLSACKNNNNSDSVLDRTYSGNGDDLPKEMQVMVPPPMLPKFDQVEKGGSKVIQVTFTVEEKKIEVAPGDSMWAFTYNGTVPGPMIVAHQGDFIELTLKNPSTNTQLHNIDFHAATGALGGGDVSLVSPGQQVTFRFRCIRAGVFVYHCAPGGLMVPIHVTMGMNGAIMVLPKDGLRDENGNQITFDRAYYIGQEDFYLPKDKDGKTINFPYRSTRGTSNGRINQIT